MMHRLYSLATCSLLLALNIRVLAAPFVASDNYEGHDFATQAISKRNGPANQTTAALPDTFAMSDASTLPSRQYTLTYSHDRIDIQPNKSLIALHWGVSNLSQALDSAINDATNRAMTGNKQPQTQLNVSFDHLSLIITPVPDVQQPLFLTWTDFTTIFSILRNDTLKQPDFSTLFVGVVGDTNGDVFAQVAILPEVVFVSQAATNKTLVNNLNGTAPSRSRFIGNPGRVLQMDPGRISMWDQGFNDEIERAERHSRVIRDGPPISGTNLRMRVGEAGAYMNPIAADRLREAYISIRDLVAILPPETLPNHMDSHIVSPRIALRRPGASVAGQFGCMQLGINAFNLRDTSPLTSHEVHAIFDALDILMNQLERITFPPEVTIYRPNEIQYTAFFFFVMEPRIPRIPMAVTRVGGPIIQVTPPPRASSNSAITSNYPRPSSQPSSSISDSGTLDRFAEQLAASDSGTWDSISEQLEASNRGMCSWWTTCFTGSLPL